MRSYVWIFLLATLVTGVKSEEADVSEAVPEGEAVPSDSAPVEAPEEDSPAESAPGDAAAPEEDTAGTATEALAEEDTPGEEAAPVASEEEVAPTEGAAETSDTAVPDGTAAPAPPDTEEETQGGDDPADETAPEATEAPGETQAEDDAEAGGSDTATEETSPDGATDAPVSEEEVEAPVAKEEVNPVKDEFDLSDALEPDNKPPADSGPIEAKGRARSAGAASGSDGTAEEPKEAGSTKMAGILAGIGVAIVGAASGYFAYQKKKLCFKPQADPESAHKEDPTTQAEPQVLSNLLSSS